MTPEFNLLDEKWIKVLCQDYTVQEVSLIDVLVHAQDYRDLAGELKAQDITVLRLLLAILHTVFSRVDKNGTPAQIEDESEALDRWEELWERGQFPEAPVRDYLEMYRDRFYLFHPERPFYQMKEAGISTEYKAYKLNGLLSQSGNSLRLFKSRSGEMMNTLTYAEAARWLLYINGFDDSSVKPKKKEEEQEKDLPKPGAGWLGKLGVISAYGDNLFQTLMLNLTFLMDGSTVWGKNCPVWELPEFNAEERREIAVPDNPAEILTLQSRKAFLIRKNDIITEVNMLSGDFFKKENAFAEQMTEWEESKNRQTGDSTFLPKCHDSSRQMWRDFESIVVQKEERKIPGIVKWISRLRIEGRLSDKTMIRFRIVSVQYGKSNGAISDEFDDSISFAASLLTEMGRGWQNMVVKEIARCEKRARCLENFARNIVIAGGGDKKKQAAQCKYIKEEFYYRLDIPFRKWLISLEPWHDNVVLNKKKKEWGKTASDVAWKLGNEIADEAGPSAFIGRKVKESRKERHYSTPEALNWFMFQINKIDKEG